MARRDLPKTLTRDEAAALLAMPNLAAPTGLRDRAMLELMYRCGLRVSEVCGLHLRDWRVKDHQLHLRPEVAKGGREAFVPLDPIAEQFLDRWKPVRRRYAAGKPHLFTTLKGGPVDRRDVWEMVVRRARKAGIRHTHPHVLRHSFATELLADGFNIREVQTLMRHGDLRTTAIYLEIRQAELTEKVRRRH
jgi:integrase/recombinase XerD